MEELGFIETSDPLVNQLFINAKWGQKGQLFRRATDCPTEDAHGLDGRRPDFLWHRLFNTDVYTFTRNTAGMYTASRKS